MKKATYFLLLAVYGGVSLLGSGGLHALLDLGSCHLGLCHTVSTAGRADHALPHDHCGVQHDCHQGANERSDEDDAPQSPRPRHNHDTCVVCQWAGQGQSSAVGVQLPTLELLVLSVGPAPPNAVVQPIWEAHLSRGPPLSVS